MIPESAQRAIRRGSTAGLVSAGLTLAVVAIAMLSDVGGELRIWNDPWNLFDLVLAVALSFGIRRRSRTTAVSMLAYFIIAKIGLSMEPGRPAGVCMGLVFTYFFARSVQGTFVYQRIRREQDSGHKPARTWTFRPWPTMGFIILDFMGLGLVSELGVVPNTVVSGTDVSTRHLDLIRSRGILAPYEEVVLFYSAGFASILEDGNVLMHRRAVSYETLDEQLTIASNAGSSGGRRARPR